MIDVQRNERFIEFFVVEIIGIGKIAERALRRGFVDANEARRMLVRERLDEGGVNEGEDGDAGAEAEREHEDGGKGEAGVFAELAEGETEILEGSFKPEGDEVVASLAEEEIVAEFAIGGVKSVLGREAGGLQGLDFLLTMEGHFFLKVGVEFFACEENFKFFHQQLEGVHGWLLCARCLA